MNIVPIAPERLRLGGTEKRTKRQAKDALGLRQIAFGKWTDHGLVRRRAGGSAVWSGRHVLSPCLRWGVFLDRMPVQPFYR
jgi:hypothetical protein